MDRRGFLRQGLQIYAAAAFPAGLALRSQEATTSRWAKQIGLQLYTVRDQMDRDFEGVLAKVAEIGYKEVEPANGYNGLTPVQFRKLLDKNGLTAPSTHVSPAAGAGLDAELDGLQIIGVRYATMPKPMQQSGGATRVPLTGAYLHGRNSWTQVEAFGPEQKVVTLDVAKRRAASLNQFGMLSSRFGIKSLVHNHVAEFEKLSDSTLSEFEVYLQECDPVLVSIQLDIGWAIIAGQDVLGLFRKYPGRFELWHVKDMFGVKHLNMKEDPFTRTHSVTFVPYGTGQVDYEPFFNHAELAGLRHFCIEQDDGPAWGDSLSAARVSFNNLRTALATGSLPDAYYQ